MKCKKLGWPALFILLFLCTGFLWSEGNAAALSEEIPIPNADFETMVNHGGFPGTGIKKPDQWSYNWWEKPSGQPPFWEMGATITEHVSGSASMYLQSVPGGYAGWLMSNFQTIPNEGLDIIRVSVKAKASPTYAGNTPRILVLFYNDAGAFIAPQTKNTTAAQNWNELAYAVPRTSFPAGATKYKIALTTAWSPGSTSAEGTLYYDDLHVFHESDPDADAKAFRVAGSAFANWWKLGEAVTFHHAGGNMPVSATTVTGTVYNSDGQQVDEVSLSRSAFIADGWRWTPSEPGYYELEFGYTKSSGEYVRLKTEYSKTAPNRNTQMFSRNRHSVVVARSETKPVEERNPMFGFSYQPNEGEDTVRMSDLIGFRFARVHSVPWGGQFNDVSWAIQPLQGTFSWNKFDNEINMLQQYGLDIVGNVLYTPQWASAHPEKTNVNIFPEYMAYPPSDNRYWTDFLSALVNRYGDRIHTWELWNEPNLPGKSVFWRGTPEEYVQLQRSGYETIKALQPNSEVWNGGLGGRSYLAFYREYVRLGGQPFYDKLTLHGYEADPRPFWQIDSDSGLQTKSWVNSESHNVLVNTIGTNLTRSEAELAQRLVMEMMRQTKLGAEKTAHFQIMNEMEIETLPWAKAQGWLVHASGLFRKQPQQEPRLAAIVAHELYDAAGKEWNYEKEYRLNGNQQAVYFKSDDIPLVVLWQDGTSAVPVDSQIAAAFLPGTTITDWEGKIIHADGSLLVQPGKMYFIRQLDESVLNDIPTASDVLVTAFDRSSQSVNVPQALGDNRPLFDKDSGSLFGEQQWIEDNWSFKGTETGTQPAEFNARMAVSLHPGGLDLVAEVSDDVFIQNEAQGEYWKGDSVQFALDAFGLGLPAEQVEFQAALTPTGPVIWKQSAPYIGGDIPQNWTPAGQPVLHGRMFAERILPGKTTYLIHVEASELFPFAVDYSKPLRFSVLVNDNDGSGRRGWTEWSSGIGSSKDPSQYGKIWLWDALQAEPLTVYAGETEPLTVTALTYGGSSIDLTRAVGYSSSNTTVAQVTYDGRVTGLSAGTTNIVLTFGLLQANVPVTVLEHDATNIPYQSTGVPGKPVLSDDNGYDTGILDGNYKISMNVWWGNNGKVYNLYENDILIDTRLLEDHSPNAQSTATYISGKKNGTYRYYAELVNEFGTTRSDEWAVTVTQAAPAISVLSSDNGDGDGNFTIHMNMWWGTNGNMYRLYENGVLIDTQALTQRSPWAQAAETTIRNKPVGTYEYRCELLNDAGITSSEKIIVRVTR